MTKGKCKINSESWKLCKQVTKVEELKELEQINVYIININISKTKS